MPSSLPSHAPPRAFRSLYHNCNWGSRGRRRHGHWSGPIDAGGRYFRCHGLIITFTLWWGYFEGVRGAGMRQLTSKNHVRAYQQWLYSHLPLTMGIASVAVGVKRVIVLAPHQLMPAQEVWILCASAGACMLSLNTIFLSSYPSKPPDEALRFAVPQYILAFLTVGVGALGPFLAGLRS